MKKIAIVIVLSFVSVLASAQGFTLKGVLVNDSTKECEPYATLKVVEKSNPAKVLKVFVSDENGKFEEKIPQVGTFLFIANSLGFQELQQEFSAKSGDKIVNLGEVYIKPASTLLKGVEVVAHKPLIKAELDKISYNIEDDPDSKTNTVTEMLRKVPMVTVDGEDNIKVKGSSSFKVYVDGKPNNMMSQNPKEVLKNMPASAIKKIEVITNPGIKYDAEGVGGILNIITNKATSLDGLMATLNGSASLFDLSSGVYAMANKGKFAVSLNYNYNHELGRNNIVNGYTIPTGEVTESSYESYYDGHSKQKGNFNWGNLEASYDVDSLRLISASLGIYGGDQKSKDCSFDYNGYAPGRVDKLFGYTLFSPTNNSWYSINGSVDYQRLFHTKDRILTLSYKIDSNPQTSDTWTTYDGKISYDDYWNTYLNSFVNQHNKGNQSTTENTFQIDYTTPFHKIHTLETGVKYIMRNNKSDNDRYDGNGEGGYDISDKSVHYRHTNNILGAYLGYGVNFGKWSGKTGVRYEHTYQSVKYKLGKGADFNTNFNDVVPQLSLGYSINDMSNLRFGYNMRIQRPGIGYLNPYLNESNPEELSQGNPNLKSEKYHSFELSYGKFSQKFNINVAASYSFTDNAIQQIYSYVKDTDIPGVSNPVGKDVLYSTYQNKGKSNKVNINGFMSWSPFTDTRFTCNLNTSYVDLKGVSGEQNSGWTFQGYGNVEQSFNHDWKVSVYYWLSTPNIELQTKTNTMMFYGLNVNKTFLNKKLKLSASVNNPFKRYSTYEYTRTGSGFITHTCAKFEIRDFKIGISYTFGEMKTMVKRTKKTIDNDDVKSGGGSSQGNTPSANTPSANSQQH